MTTKVLKQFNAIALTAIAEHDDPRDGDRRTNLVASRVLGRQLSRDEQVAVWEHARSFEAQPAAGRGDEREGDPGYPRYALIGEPDRLVEVSRHEASGNLVLHLGDEAAGYTKREVLHLISACLRHLLRAGR